MTPEDQPSQDKERIVTRNDWIGCFVVALLITASNARNYPDAGAAGLAARFIGSLAVVVLIWVTGRGVVRWITKMIKKKPIA